MRNKTLRCFYLFLALVLFTPVNAQFYRVFYHGTAPAGEYSSLLKEHCDSVWMTSEWLKYSLVKDPYSLAEIEELDFVDHIESVQSQRSFSLNENTDTSKTASDPHRQWQIDTLGYSSFRSAGINGKGIVIAVIDAGFTGARDSKGFAHIFNEGRVLRTWDFIDNDTTVFDGSTHGTGVWGCIAGNLDNKPTGLAPGASFILLRSEDHKTETMADEDRWIQAIEKAYEWGADIVTSSIGFTNLLHKKNEVNGQTLISKAATIAAEKGMIVIISAGNEFITTWKTIAIPGDADKVITVGAIDRNGSQSYFSSVGPTFDGRSKPDVVAPGTCVTINGNSFVTVSGTSFAAPLVAGYVACMLQMKGKHNFNLDSIKNYGGLYPYFDNVFGYGVPGFSKPVLTPGNLRLWYRADTDRIRIVRDRLSPTGINSIDVDHAFLKIEDVNGTIKFSAIIKLPKAGSYKIPVGKKSLFNPRKYYDPQKTDKWTIWWKGSISVF